MPQNKLHFDTQFSTDFTKICTKISEKDHILWSKKGLHYVKKSLGTPTKIHRWKMISARNYINFLIFLSFKIFWRFPIFSDQLQSTFDSVRKRFWPTSPAKSEIQKFEGFRFKKYCTAKICTNNVNRKWSSENEALIKKWPQWQYYTRLHWAAIKRQNRNLAQITQFYGIYSSLNASCKKNKI